MEQIKLSNNQHQTDSTPQVLKELEEEIAESVPGTSNISAYHGYPWTGK